MADIVVQPQKTIVVVQPQTSTVQTVSTPPAVVEAGMQGPPGAKGDPGTGGNWEVLSIVNGQTLFTLQQVADHPELSSLFFNGVKASYVTEYVIDGLTLQWLGISLNSTDVLEIIYL